VSGAKRLEIGV